MANISSYKIDLLEQLKWLVWHTIDHSLFCLNGFKCIYNIFWLTDTDISDILAQGGQALYLLTTSNHQ